MTINIGNLSVGGTGKTPMTEYLIRLLKEKFSVATLSRGYKRKSKGFIIANEKSYANDLGDEPFQYYIKFGKEVTVTVGEERALAIPKILMEHPETQVILLDDAYQHRTVTPDLNIMLTQYDAPFYDDFVLPSGMLREKRSGAKRAHSIVVTKCPSNISGDEKKMIVNRISKYAKSNASIFFSTIHYEAPKPLQLKYKFTGKVILFAGLANMQSLISYVDKTFDLVSYHSFPDHHFYRLKDLEKLVQLAKEEKAQLLTTEKDMVKLRSKDSLAKMDDVGLFYLPISVQFLFDEGNTFDSLIHEAITEKYNREEELLEDAPK